MTYYRSDRRSFCRKVASISLAGLLPVPVLSACFHERGFEAGLNHENFMIGNSNSGTGGFEPSYMKLQRSGELRDRAKVMWDMMRTCRLCPRECENDRLGGQKGEYCNATAQLQVSSYSPHFGEERPLVGRNGSGTIFFTNCAMLCVFCINWEISQGGSGSNRSIEHLSRMMLRLQQLGCHNINVVTPTHYAPHILFALDMAASQGLRLPVAYNTSGWERLEILNLLDGVIDIYLSDFKYFVPEDANRYSPGAESYPEYAKKAVIEMNRQVGVADPRLNNGILQRGLIIRHLVMPNNAGGTIEMMDWISKNLPKETYINLMSQYTPVFKAHEYPEIGRRITSAEYLRAIDAARKSGLTNLDIQGRI
jgi:putative pyruvate formate lyase activating enzyme